MAAADFRLSVDPKKACFLDTAGYRKHLNIDEAERIAEYKVGKADCYRTAAVQFHLVTVDEIVTDYSCLCC